MTDFRSLVEEYHNINKSATDVIHENRDRDQFYSFVSIKSVSLGAEGNLVFKEPIIGTKFSGYVKGRFDGKIFIYFRNLGTFTINLDFAKEMMGSYGEKKFKLLTDNNLVVSFH